MPAGCFAGAVEQPEPALGGVVEGAVVAAATQAAARGVTGVTRISNVPASAELGKGVGERGEHGGVVRWREDDYRQV